MYKKKHKQTQSNEKNIKVTTANNETQITSIQLLLLFKILQHTL